MKELQQYLEQSEERRKVIFNEEGALKVAMEAELPFQNLSEHEIHTRLKDPYELAVMTGLMLIAVDAYKSASNLTKNPNRSFGHLEKGVNIQSSFFGDPIYTECLREHISDLQNIPVAYQRNNSMLAESGADFYLGKNRDKLLDIAKGSLSKAYNGLAGDDPSRPLVRVEIELLNNVMGNPVNNEALRDDLYAVARTNYESPHTVVTVASWIWAFAKKSHDSILEESADKVIIDHIGDRKEWIGIKDKALKKQSMKKLRGYMFGTISQLVVKPGRKTELIHKFNGIAG